MSQSKSAKRQNMSKSLQTESKSLYNYTLSPGWTHEEVGVLRLALMKFGIGKWRLILKSKCLPGKSIGQIYMQTQRLIGQQSLGDYMGLCINLESVYLDNQQKKEVLRKNNCIINTGDNPTKEERLKRIAENKVKYGISEEQINSIVLPKYKNRTACTFLSLDSIESEKFTTLEILANLHQMSKNIDKKLASLELQKWEYDPNKTTVVNLKRQSPTSYKFLSVQNYEGGELTGVYPYEITLKKIKANRFQILEEPDLDRQSPPGEAAKEASLNEEKSSTTELINPVSIKQQLNTIQEDQNDSSQNNQEHTEKYEKSLN